MTTQEVQRFIDSKTPVFLQWDNGASATVLLVEIDGVWAISKGGLKFHIPTLTSVVASTPSVGIHWMQP